VQYCAFDEGSTSLQRALHRAAAVAPESQVLVTAFEEFRERWEPALWFVRPDQRFVCDNGAAANFSSAAAILSIAAKSPSNIITILPARCYVAHEWILRSALQRAVVELPRIPEGVVTLGMLDIEDSPDEDYLMVSRHRAGEALRVDGLARRPVPWVAAHLKRNGALIASGILVGYAGAFAAHISKTWPGLSAKLTRLVSAAAAADMECDIPASLNHGVPSAVVRSLRWCPPTFQQRVMGVCRSGWSGLRSPRAVARMAEFLACRKRSDGAFAIPKRRAASLPVGSNCVISRTRAGGHHASASRD
jgi:mannose-1-phosphate guanylyltransferase